jgi:DNA-binding FadR family transcriptional regulator
MQTTLRQILKAPTWQTFKESIYALHQKIFASTKNRFLIQIVESIIVDRRAVSFDGRNVDRPAPELVRQQTYADLGAIVEAIAKRQGKKAESLMADHLMRMMATVNIWQ